jgi:hypothetical protein
MIYSSLPNPSGHPGVYYSNRIEYPKNKKKFFGSRSRPVRETANLTAISQPIGKHQRLQHLTTL